MSAIDDIRSAQLLCQLKTVIVKVNRNNLCSACQRSALNKVQTDTTCPEDDNDIAKPDSRLVFNGAKACRDAWCRQADCPESMNS